MIYNWPTVLPLIFMAVMGLALLAYVILDGYDLGVGLLLPFAQEDEKDLMVASIGPFWDANETWLVLGIGVLLVAFPKAHGLVLSALYLPVAVMLIGLILRGVSFDFRVKARAARKGMWNALFAIGSAMAAGAQGWMLGSYLTAFDTGLWSRLFALGIALTLPTAYAMLGAGWLIMKTDGALRAKAVRWGGKVLWPMGAALIAISLATPMVSPPVFDKWFAMPQLIGLLPIPVACAVAFFTAFHVTTHPKVVDAGYGWLVFASTVLIFMLSFLGLAYSIYPYIVIDRMTVWQAASAHESLVVIFIGVAITLPVIIVYTVFMYRVFWGKAVALSYAAPAGPLTD
ncbi:MAG: cytochrome bd-II oxidase subunit II-like protein [Ramlibacter sp.]|jgi:cytochrome d ubiquinol oxidase subunit II|uniref:cytochrome d ubiquinol oxidase subunit II n=1 Tax=Ramlibacter sp. TaxID=1917967 RepID=UPI002638ED50|nr:cytochrome d ubiquinol oxidase subunit II [Ramlibacter sp.]MDB5753236.1 cytochrome bd-II oxidase subunit II-like protein [Ramlibacter sp.]